MDSIGAQETAKDFMVAGTATDSLLGICESLWRPDLVSRAPGGGMAGRCLSWGLTPWGLPAAAAARQRLMARQQRRRHGRRRHSADGAHPRTARCSRLRPWRLQGPEELFETVSQALLSGQDRDCLAGWGAVVYVV